MWSDLGTSGTDEVRLRKTGENLGNFGLCFVYNKNGAGTLRYDNIYDTHGNFLLTKYEKYAQIVYQTCSFRAGTSLTHEAFNDHMFFIFNISNEASLIQVVKLYNKFKGCNITIRNNAPTLYTLSADYDDTDGKITCNWIKRITFNNNGTYTSEEVTVTQIAYII